MSANFWELECDQMGHPAPMTRVYRVSAYGNQLQRHDNERFEVEMEPRSSRRLAALEARLALLEAS